MVTCSVILPTSNRPLELGITVAQLASHATDQRRYELLIVDNGQDGRSYDAIAPFTSAGSGPIIRYIHDPEPGLLTGRHRGALEACGDLLVFIDDDIDVAPGWLDAIAETFADDTVQLVGGRNLPHYAAPPPAWLEAFRWTPPHGGWALGYLSLIDQGDVMLDIDANYIWGLNFAIRRKALFDLGGFHPDNIPDHLQHFQGNGESGLTMKANERGYRAVYQPKALVHHRIPASRLTPEYFERRAFYQGVCDSYTHIRRAGRAVPLPWASSPQPGWVEKTGQIVRKLPRYARHPLKHGRNFVQRCLAGGIPAAAANPMDDETATVKARVERAYRAGYEFHRDAVARDPELLAWVLREDYWDYRLPGPSRVLRFSETLAAL